MKKVLIITYYWPPAGGGGVQRWLKFARYLPDHDWTPIVYTPENADYPILDASLQNQVPPSVEVIQTPIWEPYRFLRKISGKKKPNEKEETLSAGFIRKKKKESAFAFLIHWIRGNLIFPDARKFWIRQSVRFLKKYIRENPVDIIVSTGPPHSMHLIAGKVSAATGIPWLADFRDPWVNMDNADQFRMTTWAKARHRKWEKWVLRHAQQVVTVSHHLSEQYQKISNRPVVTITNGFDRTDFENIHTVKNEKWTIGHYGTLGADRNPLKLWQAIEACCTEDKSFAQSFQIELIGPTDIAVLDDVRKTKFADALVYIPYLKHHEVLQRMKQAAVLLVVLNQNDNEEGRVTGKIFEYLATGNRILGIGSTTSDCAKIINDTDLGKMIPFNDAHAIKLFLQKVYQEKINKEDNPTASIEKYSRQALTASLARLLNELANPVNE